MIGDMRLYVVAFFLNGVGSFTHELHGFMIAIDAIQIGGVWEREAPNNQSTGFKYIHNGLAALPCSGHKYYTAISRIPRECEPPTV